MASSTTSVFADPDDFQSAIAPYGMGEMLLTGEGLFRARVTIIRLEGLALFTARERTSRVAVVSVPSSQILATFTAKAEGTQIWNSRQAIPGSIVILSGA